MKNLQEVLDAVRTEEERAAKALIRKLDSLLQACSERNPHERTLVAGVDVNDTAWFGVHNLVRDYIQEKF